MSGQRAAVWTIALVALIAAIAYRVKVFSEPPTPPPAKLLFLTGGSSPYWQLTAAGAKAAAKRQGIELEVEMPDVDESLEEQMAILTQLKDQYDGIALSPLDAEAQTHLINGLAETMRVVTFDSDAELSERHSHIGASNFSAGRTCARLVGEAAPNGGKVAVLVVNLTKENVVDRVSGFRERIEQMSGDKDDAGKEVNYTIVGMFEDNGKSDKCDENIRQCLADNPDLACIVAMNAMQGPVLLKTLRDMDKLDDIKLITFDAEDATLDGIQQGHIYATIAQDPYKYGYEAVNTLTSLCYGEGTDLPIVGRGAMFLPVEAIRQDNLTRFRDAMRAREAEADKVKPAA
jgi:ribose transport system substrate-binding protein